MLVRIGFEAALGRGISLLGAVLVACGCGGAAPAPRPIPENALRAAAPRLVGRFDLSDPRGPKITWSGSTIEARFEGSGIAMRLAVASPPASREDEPLVYSVRIDDGVPQVLLVTPGTNRYVLAEHLDATRTHAVAVTRESEAFGGEHQFLGFELVPGGELASFPAGAPRRPRIEIVGDSITCGYGVLGKSADCRFSFATERASEAYGAIAGRALGADVTTMCWSGRGVYRNYDEPDAPTMPTLWTPDKASPPDAVVVSLGTNDVLAKRASFDAKELERTYEAFLVRIRDAYAAPWIVVTVSPMLEGEQRRVFAESLDRVVAKRRSDGDARIEVLVFEEQRDRVGCDYHPDAAMQKVMGKQLEEALRRRLR